jgi:hypothetical protein
MGVSELREAFNRVAEPRYSAQRAFLGYELVNGAQVQRISFVGSTQAGQPFTATSDPLPMNADPRAAAEQVATNLLQQGTQP